ncbi:hypothetical protein BP422_08695 [Brevibacillus formosus]|uniref:Uncharacterized protein n=1 Tax=Brevibacillus formosus TaxID=54913 RepID=A0A220MFL6_9BACL|nr:hypothetical protein BP422_08695 [Brevibacillus formosus]
MPAEKQNPCQDVILAGRFIQFIVRRYRHSYDKAWEEASAAACAEAGTATEAGARTGTTATTTSAAATTTSTTSTSPANKRRFIHLLFIPTLYLIRFYFGSL